MSKDLIADHIQRCKRLTREEIRGLELTWDRQDAEAARVAAQTAIGDRWFAVWNAARIAAGDARYMAWSIGYAAWDVVIALAAKREIWGPEFELLVGPWVSVMGRTWEE